jgi:hypothetical protein
MHHAGDRSRTAAPASAAGRPGRHLEGPAGTRPGHHPDPRSRWGLVAEKGKTQTLRGQAGFQDGGLALHQEQGRRWSVRSLAKATTRSASSRPTHPTP